MCFFCQHCHADISMVSMVGLHDWCFATRKYSSNNRNRTSILNFPLWISHPRRKTLMFGLGRFGNGFTPYGRITSSYTHCCLSHMVSVAKVTWIHKKVVLPQLTGCVFTRSSLDRGYTGLWMHDSNSCMATQKRSATGESQIYYGCVPGIILQLLCSF